MNAQLRLLLCTAAALLGGCATPPEALDQANNTVKLTEQFRGELSRYKRNLTLMADQRLKTLSQTRETLILIEVETAKLDANRRLAGGKEAELGFEDKLRSIVGSSTQLAAQEKEQRAALVELLGTVPRDLETPDAKLASVQTAMAALGENLPIKERVKEAVAFFKEVKKLSDENGKKADAAAATPAPAAPAASAAALP